MLCRGREQEVSRRDRAFSPAADAFASEPEACEDAPLPAVIEALVLRRVLAQYACTSRACLGCASLPDVSHLGLGLHMPSPPSYPHTLLVSALKPKPCAT